MLKKTETGTVSEDDFFEAFSHTAAVHVKVGKDLKEYGVVMKAGLASKMWEKRIEHLKLFRGVIKGLNSPDDILSFLRHVENELQECIVDLRSQIVKEACLCVSYLSVTLGSRLETSVEPLVGALMNLVPNGVKVMSSSGRTALKLIYQHTQSRRLISPLSVTFINSRSNVVRQVCSELLNVILQHWTSSKGLETGMSQIIEALKRGLCDSDVQVRSNTRKAFFLFYQRFKTQAETVLLSLDFSKRCQLEKELFSMSENKKVLVSSVSEIKSSISPICSSTSSLTTLAQEKVTINTSSLPQILIKMQSHHSRMRKDALEELKVLLKKKSLNVPETKSLAKCLNNFFMENDSEVITVFLSTLFDFVKVFLDDVLWWLDELLEKLLHLRLATHASLCLTDVDSVLHLLSQNADSFFVSCCNILIRKSPVFSPTLSLSVCQLLIQVLDDSSAAVFKCSSSLICSVITTLLEWTGDTRYPLLKKRSHQLLLKLSNVDCTQVQSILLTLPYHKQARACSTITYTNSPTRIPSKLKKTSSDHVQLCDSKDNRGVLTSHDLNVVPQGLNQSSKNNKSERSFNDKSEVEHLVEEVKVFRSDLVKCKISDESEDNGVHPRSVTEDYITALSQMKIRSEDVWTYQDLSLTESSVEEGQSQVCSDNLSSLSLHISQLSSSDNVKTLCTSLSCISLELKEMSGQLILEHISSLCTSLKELVTHPSSRVRKFSITCLVSIYSRVGEEMWSFICLDKSKRALFDIYFHKLSQT